MTKFYTITCLNRLINAGADRDYIGAVSAIWYLQASNDPNTLESMKIVPKILGTLEYFFIEEAKAVDEDVYELFINITKNNEYGALFSETQSIFDVGRNEISKTFNWGAKPIMEVYTHYANVMLKTTKQQNKRRLLQYLEALGEKVDELCGLANQAERDLF